MKKNLQEALKNLGLSEKEAEIYVFLAKRGVARGKEIWKGTGTPKAVVYRTLKILQRKGFVECTLESPSRFSAVPFERVLDFHIMAKHEEAVSIERAKEDLLRDWADLGKGTVESPAEKFVVIEGSNKIFAKIFQMVKETKNRLSAVSSVNGLLRADRYGIFEALYNHPLKFKVQFRLLTDLAGVDARTATLLKRRLKPALNLRCRNPELGLSLFPSMVIRDDEELIFFISDPRSQTAADEMQVCFHTNCRSMIQAFSAVFEDLWVNSTNIKAKIDEIAAGKAPQITQLIRDPASALKTYFDALDSAKNEILIVTSQKGLIELSKVGSKLDQWSNKGASIKIMAPITTEDLQATQKLLNWCEVRHFPSGYFETTIVDNCHLFQFNEPSSSNLNPKNTFYTSNAQYIQKTKKILSNIWETTRTPSMESRRSLEGALYTFSEEMLGNHSIERKTSFMKNLQPRPIGKISEKDVLAEIKKEKKKTVKGMLKWSRTLRYFGNRAIAAIHPPSSFALPNMIIVVFHCNEESSSGCENWIAVNLWQKEGESTNCNTVAFVQDTPEHLDFRKKIFAGSSVGPNIMAFKKDEIQVHMKGNTLFAGWTRPIPLGSPEYTLPPCCMLFEGYGDVKPGMFTNVVPSGRRQEFWYNSFDAFVSFFHPKSKYVGSGIEGFVERDSMLISRPPKTGASVI
ncbi:TPA: TrmB family transcriptional regulator [Candidatus Bathyarchaeota archaeon]|nr:TrmB family transcriptional regulator [Candidatus Bathyarchaeota archaeon]